MEWAEAISEAVRFIERHITEDITLYDVADSVNMSPFYFHKGFSMLCGYSVMLLLSQNIKIERCILILGINIEPDDLADLRKSINRLDVYCAASSG